MWGGRGCVRSRINFMPRRLKTVIVLKIYFSFLYLHTKIALIGVPWFGPKGRRGCRGGGVQRWWPGVGCPGVQIPGVSIPGDSVWHLGGSVQPLGVGGSGDRSDGGGRTRGRGGVTRTDGVLSESNGDGGLKRAARGRLFNASQVAPSAARRRTQPAERSTRVVGEGG